jgi:hypothetical protein
VLVVGAATTAFVAAADPAKVGDLTGNLPWGVFLLIPLAIVLAVITSLALGSGAEPPVTPHRTAGVTRALQAGSDAKPEPE